MSKVMLGGAAAAVALALMTGCSDGDGPPTGGEQTPPTEATDERVETDATVGKVVGKLGDPGRTQVLQEVTSVVDGWVDAAYVDGDYPRSDFGDAYPGFTKGAARLAAKQPATMSNAKVGDRVESVDVLKRSVRVDVLAPHRKPAGATARVKVVVELHGDVERRDRISGRVLLTPAEKGWKVFGFEVRRDQVGSKK